MYVDSLYLAAHRFIVSFLLLEVISDVGPGFVLEGFDGLTFVEDHWGALAVGLHDNVENMIEFSWLEGGELK
jgi:hypothetical protein